MATENYFTSFDNTDQSDRRQFAYIVFAVIIFILSWYIPNGKLFLYPLSLLATWFHEAGHALAAVLVGGKVVNMQITAGLSGMTSTVLPAGASNFKQAFIAAGGPVMPAIIGALMIMSGRSLNVSKAAIWVLIAAISITVIIFGTHSTGMSLIALIVLALGYAALKLDEEVMRLLVHILGIQGALSIFTNYNYLAKAHVSIAGKPVVSDSLAIASLTGTSQQLWAFSLTAFSIVVMILALLFSFGYLFRFKSEKKIGF